MSQGDEAAPGDVEARLAALKRAYAVKTTARAGWYRAGVADPESVGDHSWGTALLALEFAAAEGLDANRAAAMATVHDLPEALTGDVPYDPAQPARQEKAGRERAAIDELTYAATHLRDLWEEYEGNATPTARFVRDMNLIDMCLQAVIYADAADDGGDSLAEFLSSSQARVQTAVGRALLAHLSRDFWRGRRGTDRM
jgi:putative hydrolase of HD superfamily